MTENLSIDRETASRINPFISSRCVEDTAVGLVNIVNDLGYFLTLTENKQCATPLHGIYPIFEAIAGALEYEAKNGCSIQRTPEKEPETA